MSQQQKQQGRDQNKGANNKGGNTKGVTNANKGGNNNTQVQREAPKPRVESVRYPGIVRAVLSGDTIVVTKENTPEAINLTLMGLKAPLLGKKSKDEITKDQPFAWESRDFLRKLLIGKSVVYRVEHEVGNRTYGEVWLTEENVRTLIVQKGWAEVTVRERKDKDGQIMEPRKEDQELLSIQEAAKSKKIGIWATSTKNVRTVKYIENNRETDPATLYAFFEKNKGKTLNGVVEQVKTGSTLKVYVPSTSDEFTVSLSGVHAPVYRFNDESGSEPFSREAKFRTETYLLNRDVTVTLETMDKFNNFFGVVVDTVGKKNVAVSLLKNGLATYVDWNAPVQHAKEFQEAEKQAKEAKLRIWKKWKAPDAKTTNTVKEFLGTVVEIINAGSFVVRVQKGENYSDVTVNLSSIRVPRLAGKDRDNGIKDPSTLTEKEKKAQLDKQQKLEDDKIQNAYAVQGKEFLRKELIGKKVKATFDYISSPYTPPGSTKTLPARNFYTVLVSGKTNIAVRLVQKGLATVSLHQDGDVRSPDYKELILAEHAAKQTSQGQHAAKSKAPIVHVNDLSHEGEAACRHYLTNLKRVGRVPAVVEYIFSGSRFKVHIPTQGVTISFALQGIMSDRVVRSDKVKPTASGQPDFRALYPVTDAEGNPIPANAGLLFAREHLYQRDVEIAIEDLDRSGTFLGTLIFNKTDYILKLIEGAYAKLHRSANALTGFKQYNVIEENSKKQHKGVWWNYDEAEEQRKKDEINAKYQKEREEREATKLKERLMSLTVTEIMTGSTFFFQKATDETKELMESMMSDLQSRDWEDREAYAPTERGEWVVAKFTVDNNWYRAEVLRIIPGRPETYELRYVDYGNTEIVSSDAIRILDEDLGYVDAQAKKGKLAYIQAPGLDDDFGEDAAAYFKELVWGKTLLADIQSVDGEGSDAVYHISLGDEETKTNINGALVIQGLARVESRKQNRVLSKDFYDKLQKEESNAQKSRLCIWQYGAIPDSDEERQWANMLK